ncbi:hypothetical protein D8B26_004843 [Coccidioides posadasii str. Silveira]|uniref:uncharacterized protein n=1 Tax=Coccidioides posadasii (strain RMSCC 757 / Silveira) TaxID=443226 RepID=UPI001BF15638|nr:hypothetical protein D8B26_004843 [Coccidioides posadasii str. Silveira]
MSSPIYAFVPFLLYLGPLYNEAIRLRERYVEFNVAGHGKVVGLRKLSKGGFNRMVLAMLEDSI